MIHRADGMTDLCPASTTTKTAKQYCKKVVSCIACSTVSFTQVCYIAPFLPSKARIIPSSLICNHSLFNFPNHPGLNAFFRIGRMSCMNECISFTTRKYELIINKVKRNESVYRLRNFHTFWSWKT